MLLVSVLLLVVVAVVWVVVAQPVMVLALVWATGPKKNGAGLMRCAPIGGWWLLAGGWWLSTT